jgi:hypothetical protein
MTVLVGIPDRNQGRALESGVLRLEPVNRKG